jgi:hypothetical protein
MLCKGVPQLTCRKDGALWSAFGPMKTACVRKVQTVRVAGFGTGGDSAEEDCVGGVPVGQTPAQATQSSTATKSASSKPQDQLQHVSHCPVMLA